MSNKLRSFLTMLGVIIGVAAIILLTAVGRGATQQVASQIEQMGSNMVAVTIQGRGAVAGLSLEEVQAFEELAGVQGVAPVVSSGATVTAGRDEFEAVVEGSTPDYPLVRNFQLAGGRFLSSLDCRYRYRVAVLGSEAATELFPFSNPVGRTVRINAADFTVCGVLAPKGGAEDDRVIIPVTAARRLLRNSTIRSVYVRAGTPGDVDKVITGLESRLSAKFRGDTDAYRIFDQAAMLETVNQVSGILSLMLGGIAGISLLVGGIGIMNIMLVSVTERTREIGIRKAVGARRRHILGQFLVESVVLSGMGGLLGVAAGAGGSVLLGSLTGLSTALWLPVIVLAWAFALLVGVFFGMYPANRAAGLPPIEALRTD